MSALEFLAAVIGSLAWPVIILVVILVLRRPLGSSVEQVAQRVTGIDVQTPGGASIVISAEAAGAREILVSNTPPELDVGRQEEQIATGGTARTPREVVMAAYDSVLAALQPMVEPLSAAGAIPANIDPASTATLLVLHNRLRQSVASAIAVLVRLHERIAQLPDSDLTDSAVREFVELSASIRVRLGSPSATAEDS